MTNMYVYDLSFCSLRKKAVLAARNYFLFISYYENAPYPELKSVLKILLLSDTRSCTDRCKFFLECSSPYAAVHNARRGSTDTAHSVPSRISTLTLWPVTKGIGPRPPVPVSCKLGLTACTHLTALLWKSNAPLSYVQVLSCSFSFIYKIDVQNLLQVDKAYVQRDHNIILLRS